MALRTLCLSVAIVFSVLARRPLAGDDGSKEADRIPSLPGQPPDVRLQQYSGYVNVDRIAGKSLFYYFVESPTDPAQKHLLFSGLMETERKRQPHYGYRSEILVALNCHSSGPGCSSFGLGALQEIGPFRVDTDGKTLCRHKYSWTSVANILFLESPVGVGFSYAVKDEVYKTMGDNMTAVDSYAFLLKWFDRFPEYKGREFFIAGESYAGHYVPELAYAILVSNNNRNPSNAHIINLKGIAIGNAILEYAEEQSELYEYLWQRTFISDSAHANIAQHCKGPEDDSPVCVAAKDIAYGHTGDISAYNIYSSTCHEKKVRPTDSKCMIEYCCKIRNLHLFSYMNQPHVQKAMHANTELKYPWSRCRTRTYNLRRFGDSPKSMLPYIKALVTSGIRIWLYSGDLDVMVPVTASKHSVEKLRLAVVADWRPWSTGQGNKDVAGYVIVYKGLLFSTVRGSGHMVPIDQPERGLALFTAFVRGQQLPSSGPQTD